MGASGHYLLMLECDRYPKCKHYRDFEGSDRADCEEQARRAGWEIDLPEQQTGDAEISELCPGCWREMLKGGA